MSKPQLKKKMTHHIFNPLDRFTRVDYSSQLRGDPPSDVQLLMKMINQNQLALSSHDGGVLASRSQSTRSKERSEHAFI